MFEIRKAQLTDATSISNLLESLGYPGTMSFIQSRLQQMLSHPDEVMLVALKGNDLVGFISLHFIPQIALLGDFCRISYFCVSEHARGFGVGAMLESKAVKLAMERKCDRIEVHCHARRVDAHRFYFRQNYVESPKYLCKLIETAQPS